MSVLYADIATYGNTSGYFSMQNIQGQAYYSSADWGGPSSTYVRPVSTDIATSKNGPSHSVVHTFGYVASQLSVPASPDHSRVHHISINIATYGNTSGYFSMQFPQGYVYTNIATYDNDGGARVRPVSTDISTKSETYDFNFAVSKISSSAELWNPIYSSGFVRPVFTDIATKINGGDTCSIMHTNGYALCQHPDATNNQGCVCHI